MEYIHYLTSRQRAKPDRINKMIRCQMGIAHGHSQAGMAQDLLQGEDVPALLYEVTDEGMP